MARKKKIDKQNFIIVAFSYLVGSVGVFATWFALIIFFFGDLYFFYLGFKLGSPWMVAMSFVIWPLVGPLGAYCFVFGIPMWMMSMLN